MSFIYFLLFSFLNKENQLQAAITANKSTTPKTTKQPVNPSTQAKTPSTFGEAFKQARKEGKKSFTFKGKSYAAVTMDEVKKKGHKTLQSYLNAKGKPKKLKKDIKER